MCRLLKVAAMNVHNQVGRAAFLDVTDTAEKVIEIAEMPFRNGKAYILGVEASLRSLEILERTYRTNIESLKSSKAGPAPSSSRRRSAGGAR